MLAVIAPTQPVSAVLAASNECCLVGTHSSIQHKEHQPAQQRDAVNTQVMEPPSAASSNKQLKPQMGVLQVHNYQGVPSSAVPCNAGAAAGGSAAEPSSSCGSKRHPSRSERKTVVPTVAGYSTDSYWNSRYAERSTHFDWFYNYTALAELINTTCDTEAGPCLHVGCGNSGFSKGMVEDGYQVINVDISPVVIEQMRVMDQIPGQTWEVADCRSMPQYQDASFGSVLDKGTLDAVLCSSHGTADAAFYINEVYRLLAPGGVFLLISLGQPHARLAALKAAPAASAPAALPYLSADLQQRAAASIAAGAAAAAASLSTAGDQQQGSSVEDWQWQTVEVYLLPKPNLYMQSESSLTGKPIVAHMRHSDKDMPVEWLGPFKPGSELDTFIEQHDLDMREFFTAFACMKPSASETAAGAAAKSSAQ